ncbi:hypothetical protein F511_21923 [Dorcoceras hygrometricum]|uniref:Uncharacterized protein n=1 Tax=Dorcoceras hygrometricum TaxID=472368 RepID=A0A2Z7ASP6_9LAMI|nr:hypothetical protein F511_21923 [Dorcoceras hygrometricum]
MRYTGGSDLREQIRVFIFDAGSDARTFRIIRGELARGCHMLVNVARLTSAVSFIQIQRVSSSAKARFELALDSDLRTCAVELGSVVEI